MNSAKYWLVFIEMHEFQMKVNPNLVVEVKPNQVPREMRNEIARKLRAQRMHVMPYALYYLAVFRIP